MSQKNKISGCVEKVRKIIPTILGKRGIATIYYKFIRKGKRGLANALRFIL